MEYLQSILQLSNNCSMKSQFITGEIWENNNFYDGEWNHEKLNFITILSILYKSDVHEEKLLLSFEIICGYQIR